MSGYILLALIATASGGIYYLRVRRHPYRPCPACKGRRGQNWGSNSRVWGRCPRCKGRGEIRRLASRLLDRGQS